MVASPLTCNRASGERAAGSSALRVRAEELLLAAPKELLLAAPKELTGNREVEPSVHIFATFFFRG